MTLIDVCQPSTVTPTRAVRPGAGDRGGAVAAGGAKAEAVKQVETLIDATLASDDHRWFLGQMTQGEKAQRAKQREEFTKRYVTQQAKSRSCPVPVAAAIG